MDLALPAVSHNSGLSKFTRLQAGFSATPCFLIRGSVKIYPTSGRTQRYPQFLNTGAIPSFSKRALSPVSQIPGSANIYLYSGRIQRYICFSKRGSAKIYPTSDRIQRYISFSKRGLGQNLPDFRSDSAVAQFFQSVVGEVCQSFLHFKSDSGPPLRRSYLPTFLTVKEQLDYDITIHLFFHIIDCLVIFIHIYIL